MAFRLTDRDMVLPQPRVPPSSAPDGMWVIVEVIHPEVVNNQATTIVVTDEPGQGAAVLREYFSDH